MKIYDECLGMTMMTNTLIEESSHVYLSNVLNEVLHGFRLDFEVSLVASREDVMRIFEELTGARGGRGGVERLSPAEVRLLVKCADLCLRELAGEEFETRLGQSPEVARRINGTLSAGMELSPAPA